MVFIVYIRFNQKMKTLNRKGDNVMREFRMCWVALIGLIAAALAPAVAGTGYHVSPAASGSGDGSRSNPWQFHAALQSSSVKPGDTVWIHGGTYSNPNGGVFQFVWECTLNG